MCATHRIASTSSLMSAVWERMNQDAAVKRTIATMVVMIQPVNLISCSPKLDNVRDHRAGTIILQAEKSARKPGFACITLLSGVLFDGKSSFGSGNHLVDSPE